MTPALTAEEAVKMVNDLHNGYDPTDISSPKGVIATWVKLADKKMNLYCPDIKGNDWGGCYDGSSTCRMSAMVHNKELPVDQDGSFLTFADRNVGFVFNADLVDSYFGKCGYIYDGGSNNRYNYGCGNSAIAAYVNCSGPNQSGPEGLKFSPESNICPSSGTNCTIADEEVNAVSCDKMSDGHATEDTRGCFYKGAAYAITEDDIQTPYSPGQTMWKTESQVRTMVDDRNEVQKTYTCPSEMCWNEIVIDERLMLTQLAWDPLSVVQAIVYHTGDDDAAAQAATMQKAFQDDWGASPPLIMVDVACKLGTDGCGPFSAPGSSIGV